MKQGRGIDRRAGGGGEAFDLDVKHLDSLDRDAVCR
jgi:hypothetical protein